MIYLGDDGTMDTVLVCSECGEEMRYNYDPTAECEHGEDCKAGEAHYDDFVAWAIEDATADHECEAYIADGERDLS